MRRLCLDRNAQIIAVAEDLGRHNALDKVIGMCLLKDADLSGCGVLLSSRLSLEMITKAIRAGFEIIAAVSAPTSLAIEIADRFRCDPGWLRARWAGDDLLATAAHRGTGRGRCPLKGSVPLCSQR
jgi:hypothetical protein